MTVTNFDQLNALRTEAARCGAGSKAWIEFATVMFESFPALYRTAKAMNTAMADIKSEKENVEQALRDLVAQVELHTDCMDGRIERDALDEQMDAAERLVGTWPEFSIPEVIDNPVQAGIDRTVTGAIGQP